MAQQRLPRHVGFIPDGNRRWAAGRGLPKSDGYAHGVDPGFDLLARCEALGIEEASVFCFTQDNTKRPSDQTKAFRAASTAFAHAIADRVALLVVGDETSPLFPEEMRPFRTRQGTGMRVNLLMNYGWEWDLAGLGNGGLRSAEVSRMDLIVRWGGMRRLSGFLPVQSVYADFHVCDAFWPDYEPAHFDGALEWFARQDRTLGG